MCLVGNSCLWPLRFFRERLEIKIRNFNDFSIRKIREKLHNDGCGGTFWLRQEGTHVSYRQSSIIYGGHFVRSSRGTGAAGCARPKSESGKQRIFCTNGPTASTNFYVWP